MTVRGRALRLSPQTVSRLEKLLPMLSSDHDGEALNAVRAIDRTLRTAGRDWHDLTASLTVPAETKTKARDGDGANDDWRTARQWCADREEFLSEREAEFISSLAHWQSPTERQLAWLKIIQANIRRRQAHDQQGGKS